MSKFDTEITLRTKIVYNTQYGYVAARCFAPRLEMNLYDLRMEDGHVITYAKREDFKVVNE